MLKKSLPIVKIFTCFLLKVLYFLTLTFRCMIHLELIFYIALAIGVEVYFSICVFCCPAPSVKKDSFFSYLITLALFEQLVACVSFLNNFNYKHGFDFH